MKKTNQTKVINVESFQFDKVMPQALDLEKAILGAILIDRDAIVIVSAILQIDSFYDPKHQIIFGAMMELYSEMKPIDTLTIVEQLNRTAQLEAIGNAYYVVELTNSIMSSSNIEYHCRIVQQKWIKRQSIINSFEIIEKGFDDTVDCFDLLDNQEIEIDKIKGRILTGNTQSNTSLANELLDDIFRVANSDDKILGTRLFGIPELDEALDGGENDDLIIIGARPGMGKSSIFNSAAVNAVRENKAVLIWSAEMSKVNQVGRLIAALANIDYNKMRKDDITDDERAKRDKAIDEFSASKVIIKDQANINVIELRSEIITMKRKFGIEAVFFDRIEKFTALDRQDERIKLGFAASLLKRTAQEIGVPIVIAAQLNRKCEDTPTKRPELFHLQMSGAMEQEATKVVLLYRPEYYGFEFTENDDTTKDLAECIIAKNRNKKTTSVNCRFNGKCMAYESFDVLDFDVDATIDKNYMANMRVDTSDGSVIPF